MLIAAFEQPRVSVLPRIDVANLPLRRFSVDEYHQMIRLGFFADDESFELLEGWVTPKMSRGPKHDVVILRLDKLLTRMLPDGFHTRCQCGFVTAESEPEPDVVIVCGDVDDFVNHHPGPSDAVMVIEVADSSLGRDRTLKQRLLARAGVVQYVIINLPEARVEVYTNPSGPTAEPAYADVKYYAPGDSVAITIAGNTVGQLDVASLLS
jgi:Uma2 family endonuclease